MFGHLKSQNFVNLMEGFELPSKQRAHLGSCVRCHSTWLSLQSVHAEVSSLDRDIPEPDWTEFRAAVRDQLLSRSIQRESAVRRWTGWAIRPAMAWALSLLLAVGVTTGAFLWKIQRAEEPVTLVVPPAVESAVYDMDADPAVYSPAALFDDLVQLGEIEQEKLRKMLESAHQ